MIKNVSLSLFQKFLDVCVITIVFSLKAKEKFSVLNNYTECPLKIFQEVKKWIIGLKWIKLVLQAPLP